MMQMPTIRLDLEHMRHSMIHAVHDYNGEMEQFISEELKRQVDSFDYEHAMKIHIENEMHAAVSKAVKDWFTVGNGAHLVYSVVSQQLEQMQPEVNPRKARRSKAK